MDQIGITCLGSGSALGEGRMWSSLLIDGKILLDLPPTAISQLYRVGADIAAIDYVFISHFHGDHVFGVPFFLLLYHFSLSRDRPLYLVGPRGLADRVHELYRLAWPNLAKHGLPAERFLRFVEVTDAGDYRAGDLSFTAVPMEHFGLAAYGYRFNHNGRVIAYTGDTGECPQLHRLIAGADIVITECTHPTPANDPGHLDVRAVARIAHESKGAVLATHLSGNPPPLNDNNVTFCRDGETYVV